MLLHKKLHFNFKYETQRDVEKNWKNQQPDPFLKRRNTVASSATPNDNRMISTIKKNSFPTFNKVMNLFGKIDVSLSRCTIKRMQTTGYTKEQKGPKKSAKF